MSILADLLIPNLKFTPEYFYNKYPARNLPEGAKVTRLGPSPTGFFHIGGLYTGLISRKLAHENGDVFFLRIEDTDRKREVEGAADLVVQSLEKYGLTPDEGAVASGLEVGDYGPYTQSLRFDIYRAFVHKLIHENKAYACFATPEELDSIREQQEQLKIRPGYYGEWAVWRNRSEEDVLSALSSGKPYVIRLKSTGNINRQVVFPDLIRGTLELYENDQDIVFQKSDGFPTYHAAHVIDDHLMGTTHVIRGDEWVSSITLHLQLFQTFGWKPPHYGHLSPIQKMDGNSRRKLSKRKDPEASVLYYDQQGYPLEAVIEYLLNLADSRFEGWRKSHPLQDNSSFQLDISNMSRSGALFDIAKLNSISKDVVSSLQAHEVYKRSVKWAVTYNSLLADRLQRNPSYSQQILNIERESDQSRKDVAKWLDLEHEIGYFFDDYFKEHVTDFLSPLADVNIQEVRPAIQDFMLSYDEADSKDEWFLKLQTISVAQGFAPSTKAFKKDPSSYKGHVGDVAKVIRVLLTGRNKAPDLWEVMKVMGRARVSQRLSVISEF
ncbi:MAG: glutamate--tRNA ligase [Leptolyngbya sp. BL-A-14]